MVPIRIATVRVAASVSWYNEEAQGMDPEEASCQDKATRNKTMTRLCLVRDLQLQPLQ